MSESADFTPRSEDAPGMHASEMMIGAASPLWGYFMGAAASGMAWWWMTRWAQTQNLEAMFGIAERAASKALEPSTEAASVISLGSRAIEQTLEATPEAADAAAKPIETAAATVAEVAVESSDAAAQAVTQSAERAADSLDAAAPIAEAIIEPVLPPVVVGGEAAPISPLVEAVAPQTAAATPREPRRPKATSTETGPAETAPE
jgi:hypothetical protein